MPGFPPLPPDFESWTFAGGRALARRDVAPAVRSALEAAGSLHRWAAARPDRAVFHGRGEAYGVALGPVESVVRHARRGGLLGPLLGDRYFAGARVLRELELSRRLAAAGLPTPAVIAGVVYPAPLWHRADVATERVHGEDLAALFFGHGEPNAAVRAAALDAAARLVGRLHAAGFVHPDLQLRNVIVAATPGAEAAAWILDVDTCRAVAPDDRSARASNLARFFRSWDKWNRTAGPRLTASNRERFLRAYAEANP